MENMRQECTGMHYICNKGKQTNGSISLMGLETQRKWQPIHYAGDPLEEQILNNNTNTIQQSQMTFAENWVVANQGLSWAGGWRSPYYSQWTENWPTVRPCARMIFSSKNQKKGEKVERFGAYLIMFLLATVLSCCWRAKLLKNAFIIEKKECKEKEGGVQF